MTSFRLDAEEEPPDEAASTCTDKPPSSVRNSPISINRPLSVKGDSPAKIVRRLSSWTRTPREVLFPNITDRQWNDWRWQLQNRFTTISSLGRHLELSADEKAIIRGRRNSFPLSITPYYMTLIHPWDVSDPVRRSVVPTVHEGVTSEGELEDPLGEEEESPVPGLVHRYPDRVLLIATNRCSVYCRYCTRSRMVGKRHSSVSSNDHWNQALEYIKQHTEVRDVLISGGDPLLLRSDLLDTLLGSLRKIRHLEILRIGTKVPVVLPQRITPDLIGVLRKYHPLWMNIHFTHPRELTLETSNACTLLADAGIPLGSQTVLLAGINDEVDTMKELFQKLLRIRVRPYYLYQCDRIKGSAHFTTPVSKGLEIIKGLRGFTSGLAVPQYVIDAPAGGGKIPLLPEYCLGVDEQGLALKNYAGNIHHYPDKTLPPITSKLNSSRYREMCS